MDIKIIMIADNELNTALFADFSRHQNITKCWRKVDGKWIIIDNPFVEDWGKAEYEELVRDLKHTIKTGGAVYGAFDEGGRLVGFVSVENELFGSKKQYIELSSMHVTEDMRGRGIGKRLFLTAACWAKEQGAEKLYISGHSSVESQAFYKAMGCREAEEYSAYHVEKEPCDCQLELPL